ncbi:GIY-YIG nuclease family protein [Streptomyces microflavus]|uniref:GIY-YIG nuclease family protein n=1 Tax=Streptomyces microflavus TaxID=1919 RepID=UPI0029AEF588|nr:GIY-YIG nuclease family protein [Streptomyces microflavus]MDX2407357.1 GIY-YIG nuclease family protein [Streptomyces microflavus]
MTTTTPPTLPAQYRRLLPPAPPPAHPSFLRLQERARAILLASAAAPLPQPVLQLQRQLRDRVFDELLDTGAARHRLYVLEIAGPNPRIKIGRTQNLWKRIDQHLRDMNRYQYGLVNAHLTEPLPDERALKRAEAHAHAWMAQHYQPITKEEYVHADYDFAVTCANAAAGLTRPIRKQPPA